MTGLLASCTFGVWQYPYPLRTQHFLARYQRRPRNRAARSPFQTLSHSILTAETALDRMDNYPA